MPPLEAFEVLDVPHVVVVEVPLLAPCHPPRKWPARRGQGDGGSVSLLQRTMRGPLTIPLHLTDEVAIQIAGNLLGCGFVRELDPAFHKLLLAVTAILDPTLSNGSICIGKFGGQLQTRPPPPQPLVGPAALTFLHQVESRDRPVLLE